MFAAVFAAVAATPAVAASPTGTCPEDLSDPVLVEICRDADAILMDGEESEFVEPASEGDAQESGDFGTLATESCTYYDTKYASGSGTGDVLYGYTTNLGAKAAARAHTTTLVYQNRIAYVTMRTGHRFKWNGSNTHTGRVVMPWYEGGSISTSAQSSFFASTSASGTAQIETWLLDETSGEVQKAIETTHLQSGTSYKNYSASGTRVYAVTYRPGHTYRPYILFSGSAQAQGTVFNPLLQADSIVDWMGGSNGAYLSYVRYEVDLPDGWTLTCS